MPTPRTPHIALPLSFTKRGNLRSVDTVEQGTDQEIDQCVRTILAYEKGSREELTDFGVPELAFMMGGVDPAILQQVIAEWEPRAIADIQEDPSRLSDFIEQIRINLGEQANG